MFICSGTAMVFLIMFELALVPGAVALVLVPVGCGRTIRGSVELRMDAIDVGALKTRQGVLRATGAAIAGGLACGISSMAKASDEIGSNRTYFQRFPTLFAPLYGAATKKTILRKMAENVWALEQNLSLGPLETPLRCVVVRLKDGTLWVHNPLAPTQEFFALVESCAGDFRGPISVAHVVVSTYALEHKIFAKGKRTSSSASRSPCMHTRLKRH